MPGLKLVEKLSQNTGNAPTLSPLGDPSKPDSLILLNIESFRELFTGRIMGRSPGKVRRLGLLRQILEKSALLKVKSDIARGFDVSIVHYPPAMDILAWGIAVDELGRIFEIKSDSSAFVELAYQGGSCRTRRDWERVVGDADEHDFQKIRQFYNKVRLMVNGRISLAACMGFGLWDALWMCFDFEKACYFLENDSNFVERIFLHWKEFHIRALNAILDSGIKIVFFKESPSGFPGSRQTAPLLDNYLRKHFQDLTGIVKSRGGSIFLDCDSDEILETDYALEWGFDGIGPMIFRDEEDLILARRCLSDDLILIGSTLCPSYNRLSESSAEEIENRPAEFIKGTFHRENHLISCQNDPEPA